MILSVSRRTDIPAFYSDWFYKRIQKGVVCVRNPFNPNQISSIQLTPQVIDCIVFWTKNPSQAFIESLHLLDDYSYYFQFTLNAYDSTIEQQLPVKSAIIENFRNLSLKIGKEKVIWRYDPIFLSPDYTLETHIHSFEQIIKQIYPYTEKCIISFIDIYRKIERKMNEASIRQPDGSEVLTLASKLKEIASLYGLSLETCAENYDLEFMNIKHTQCIDKQFIERITGKRLKVKKDSNQRSACRCAESIDIGAYNTCMHTCLYCYANDSLEKVMKNVKEHMPNSPILIGNMEEKDQVIVRKVYSLSENGLFS